VVVWIDGACSLCCTARTWTLRRDRSEAVVFRDFRACEVQSLPGELDQHDRGLWVLAPDGTLHRGYSAVLRVLATLRRWRWLEAVAGRPPLHWIGERLYAVVARSRFRFRALPWSNGRARSVTWSVRRR